MEPWDFGFFDEDAFDESSEVRCKYCNQRDLYWEETLAGWRLIDGEGKPHICPNRLGAVTKEEFA